MSKKTSLEEKFAAGRGEPNARGCIEWTALRTTQGYGLTSHNGRNIRAHRAAWIIARGEIPAGLVVCHSCDNPPCVNVEHLFLGTVQDNNADKIQKGRHARGVTHPQAKIHDDTVVGIRAMYDEGFSIAAIAEEVGLSQAHVRKTIRGVNWSHLPQSRRYEMTQNKKPLEERMVTVDGETLMLSQWSERIGCKLATLWSRIDRGMDPDVAVRAGRNMRRAG